MTAQTFYSRSRIVALDIGIVCFIIYFFGMISNPEQFFRSYLPSYLFWLEISLGCFALLMVHNLTGGKWGASIRNLLEAGRNTIWLMALLFAPILTGLSSIYPWAQTPLPISKLGKHRELYLQPAFFTARAVLYFAIWVGLTYLFRVWSDGKRTQVYKLSAIGLVLYCFSSAFASIDWIMSLEPHWYSTIFGMIFFVSHGLSAITFVLLLGAVLARFEPFFHLFNRKTLNDLGNILLVFVLLWTYLNFSQFLIIWAGNKPEEVEWYFRRLNQGWQWLAILLLIFQFVVPFSLLLFRRNKRHVWALGCVALIAFLARILDVFWYVAPGLQTQLGVHWMDIISLFAIGGIWLFLFFHQLLWGSTRELPYG